MLQTASRRVTKEIIIMQVQNKFMWYKSDKCPQHYRDRRRLIYSRHLQHEENGKEEENMKE